MNILSPSSVLPAVIVGSSTYTSEGTYSSGMICQHTCGVMVLCGWLMVYAEGGHE
jgi:hypothetical protein